MVYIYQKVVDGKEYYYLRASRRQGTRIITKDIAYLGNTLEEARSEIQKLPQKDIRAAYRTIEKFFESKHYLEQAKKLNLKSSHFIGKLLLEEIDACKLHWKQVFQKHDELTKQEYFKKFAIDFAFNTTSIEGNTITLKEASILLTEQLTPKNKTLREIYDIQNTEKVFLDIIKHKKEVSHAVIVELHKNLMSNVDCRIGYRTGEVHVIHSRFASTPAKYIKTDMDLLFKWFENNKQILHSFALATIFHHKFEKIHPFFDGNGRTGRMLFNLILLDSGYSPIIIRKKNRAEYLDALRKADTSGIIEATPLRYKPLVEFLATEFINSYWNNFL